MISLLRAFHPASSTKNPVRRPRSSSAPLRIELTDLEVSFNCFATSLRSAFSNAPSDEFLLVGASESGESDILSTRHLVWIAAAPCDQTNDASDDLESTRCLCQSFAQLRAHRSSVARKCSPQPKRHRMTRRRLIHDTDFDGFTTSRYNTQGVAERI